VPARQPIAAPYWLYLLECEGGSYYAGIALDVEQRFFLHVFGRGARYTRAHPPLRVLAATRYASKGEALRAEYRLKQLPRGDKLAFFAPGGPRQ
jgi:putative endonuclease